MQEESSKCLADNATKFRKSLQELRAFSSQLYNAADYCESAFLNAEDKRNVVETTKEYVSRAVVTVVDHIGAISANLEHCISKSNSIPETELRIDCLKQRLVTSQKYTHKLALGRLYWRAEFSRYHCRYICPPVTESTTRNVVFRDFGSRVDAKSGKQNQFETEGPLFFYTYNFKPSLAENSKSKVEKKNECSPPVLPARESLSMLPKAKHSIFQFQEAQKPKSRTLNRKLMQNKEIASLIRRGKRILA